MVAAMRTNMRRFLIWFRANIAAIARPWVAELVIAGHLPQRFGRYLVVDMLLMWSEEPNN
jgi:hypothetical protein